MISLYSSSRYSLVMPPRIAIAYCHLLRCRPPFHFCQCRVSHFYIEDFTSTRDKVNLYYISEFKIHVQSQFCKIELGLKFTS